MQTRAAQFLIQINRELLAKAARIRAESQRIRGESFDARVLRALSVNRPGLWGDLMVAWTFAQARARQPSRSEGEAHGWSGTATCGFGDAR